MANSDAGTSSGKAGGGPYQVFLNFFGQDIRDGFTDFLYQDLVENCIHVFMDDQELPVGEEIRRELLQAIDNSQIYIPIFSRNYASSKWCLRELATMVDSASKSEEKKILPIFYDVEPKDVDLKTPLYRTAIEKHKEKFPHEVESWEEALKKVHKIKGWVLPKCKSQAELVDSVVKEVLLGLKIRYKSATKDLVGLDDRVTEVLKLLDVDCNDEVRLLGIHGVGGIGKTTIAKVVYDELSSHFGKCCVFLDDVRETSKKEGLPSLQKMLLKEIDSSGAVDIINDVDYGRGRMEAALGNKKALIVLDDIDEEKQIDNLIGQGRLHPGTRIIITTTNTGVLKIIEQRMTREMKEVNSSYEMEEMKFDHALQLFKRHAFGEDSLTKDFHSLSVDIVKTTGSLPLALEVIGSSLYGEKEEAIWRKKLDKLKDIPIQDVRKKLMISYDALSDCQRKIFLDVACFFINEDVTNPIYMWNAYIVDPNTEIKVLVRMSLIKKWDNNKLWMHDQLRDLGREIVRQGNSENLKKWSRVWTKEEVLHLVRTKERHEDVEALDLREWGGSYISISPEEIGSFKSLRFLRLSNVLMDGDFIVASPRLRWISWRSAFQIVSGPSMHSMNLVVFELFDNHFTNDSKVWDLIKMAIKLKNLTLVKCCGITRTPDLSKCLNLERLTFDHCERLQQIHYSIGMLPCLLYLNITGCGLIERVPNEIGVLVKLECFSLHGSSSVSMLPTSIGNLASLRKLDLSSTRITSLPESIGKLRCLSDLDLSSTRITSLPKSIGKLRCLSDLILQDSIITEIPSEIEGLVELRHFHMGNTKIKQLPDLLGKLKSLRTLNLSSCGWNSGNSNRWLLPKAIGKLEKLEELYLGWRKELEGEIPDEIGHLSSLRVLDLCLTKIYRVPGTINMLSCLSTLYLTRCDEIRELPELPTSLVHLHVQSSSLEVIPNLSNLTNLVDLILSDWSENGDSSNLKHKCDLGWIGRLSKLKELGLAFLNFTAPAPELGLISLLEHLSLRGLDLQPLKQLPPSLLYLYLHNFSSTGLPLSNLKVLSHLDLNCSQLQEIELDGLLQLRFLSLCECDLQSVSIPSSLQALTVYDCPNMFEIQFLGMSASLEFITISNCQSIGRIVLCGEVGPLGILNQPGSSSSESTNCSLRVLLLSNAFKKLKELKLSACEKLLEIQVVGTWLSLQEIHISSCDAIEKFSDISNLKNLHRLFVDECSKLQVVEGLDELEILTLLSVTDCPSLETLLDILNSKIPDGCVIRVDGCSESLDYSLGWWYDSTFKDCKMRAQRGLRHSEKNEEEAKVEELQPSFHSSASSRDHEFSEEPPIDNVTEGTPTEKQNQTTEKDSNPSSLDEVAPPRTFCDRFKTCLVSILECICNRDFPS